MVMSQIIPTLSVDIPRRYDEIKFSKGYSGFCTPSELKKSATDGKKSDKKTAEEVSPIH